MISQKIFIFLIYRFLMRKVKADIFLILILAARKIEHVIVT